MNKPFDTVRSRFRYITAISLVAMATGLIVSALMAKTTPESGKKTVQMKAGECKDWPCKDGSPNCTTIKENVADALTHLINQASDGTPDGIKLRNQLLGRNNCWQQAHQIVQKRLQGLVPPVAFGPEHQVVFYEPEDYPSSKSLTWDSYPAPNHCLHVIYLPKSGRGVKGEGTFRDNLMCCYIPW